MADHATCKCICKAILCCATGGPAAQKPELSNSGLWQGTVVASLRQETGWMCGPHKAAVRQ